MQGSDAGRRSAGRLVVYPIDRTRATPLTVYCPIDVMRNTLGVGACEYILDVEGIGSREAGTPRAVTAWVERQFARGRARRAAEAIRERLDQMRGHLRRTEARIVRYGEFAGRVRRLCAEYGAEPRGADVAAALGRIVEDLSRAIELRRQARGTAQSVDGLATAVAALIDKPGALGECRKLGGKLRAIGDAQDGTLSRCRMHVRRLRLAARTYASRRPRSALALNVAAQAEEMLRKQKPAAGGTDEREDR
jgi:hypothetical protein